MFFQDAYIRHKAKMIFFVFLCVTDSEGINATKLRNLYSKHVSFKAILLLCIKYIVQNILLLCIKYKLNK